MVGSIKQKIRFEIIDSLHGADIKVYWTKENNLHAGMQYTEQIGNLKILSMTIGLMDIYGNSYSSYDVYKIILHEFGHVLGLGHSSDKKDVMAATWNRFDTLSKNDILVLNLIYNIGSKSYEESEKYIEAYLSQNLCENSNTMSLERDILCEMQNIGDINKYKLSFQNINVKYPKI